MADVSAEMYDEGPSQTNRPRQSVQAASLAGRPQVSGIMSDAPTKEEKLSPVEGFKTESNYLRGPIPAELVDGNDHFGKET